MPESKFSLSGEKLYHAEQECTKSHRGLMTWVQFCKAIGASEKDVRLFRENPLGFFEQFGKAIFSPSENTYLWSIGQYFVRYVANEKTHTISVKPSDAVATQLPMI